MKSYLHDNFGEAVTLNQLAELVSLSPYHFLRKFKAEYHVSPQQMLMAIRLSQAKRMLERGMPAAQVAAAAGLTDQAHLTRAFANRYGVTPVRFQKQVKWVKTATCYNNSFPRFRYSAAVLSGGLAAPAVCRSRYVHWRCVCPAAGLMWGLIFVGPLLVPDYPAALQSTGRYLAFGLITLPLAWFDRRRLRKLRRRIGWKRSS